MTKANRLDPKYFTEIRLDIFDLRLSYLKGRSAIASSSSTRPPPLRAILQRDHGIHLGLQNYGIDDAMNQCAGGE